VERDTMKAWQSIQVGMGRGMFGVIHTDVFSK
jgi:hypothetical protein